MTTENSKKIDSRMDDAELDRRLGALTRTAEPVPANWAAIERRIGQRRWRHLMPAGMAAAAVLTGVALVVSQIAPAPETAGTVARVMRAEVQAMRASAPETPAVSEVNSPTALMAAWQENQAAIDQLEQALDRDPDNRLLLDFLTEARIRQAELARFLVRSDGREQPPNDERSINL